MNKTLNLFARYFIILLLGLGNLFLISKLFTPLTIYTSHFLLSIFFNTTLAGHSIIINNNIIEIINACIATSAYYLLLILNLSTPIKPKTRLYSIVFSLFALFLLNILRIFILSILFLKNSSYFDITHSIFWFLLSIIFVVGIWFLTIRIFKIKNLPIYTDLKFITSKIS